VGIPFPGPLKESVDYLASLNTPLAMLVTGASIAQANLLSALSNLRIYYISFLRLIVVPVIVVFIFKLLPLDHTVMLTNLIATACPAGTSAILFATRFDKDYIYSSELIAVTNILCLFSIPLILFFSQLMG
jgi:predicted permease